MLLHLNTSNVINKPVNHGIARVTQSNLNTSNVINKLAGMSAEQFKKALFKYIKCY